MSETPPRRRRPVLVEMAHDPADAAEGAAPPAPSPQDAPPPPDAAEQFEEAVVAARRRRSFWGRLALWSLAPIVTIAGGLWLYGIVETAIARSPWLGAVASTLAILLAVALAALILKEIAAIGRLRRVTRLRQLAERALQPDEEADDAAGSVQDAAKDDAARRAEAGAAAEAAIAGMETIYRGRTELAWARAEARERGDDAGDGPARFARL